MSGTRNGRKPIKPSKAAYVINADVCIQFVAIFAAMIFSSAAIYVHPAWSILPEWNADLSSC